MIASAQQYETELKQLYYYKFAEKFGGRLVGILKDTVMLEDGKLHDEVMFEMFKKDYNNRVPK